MYLPKVVALNLVPRLIPIALPLYQFFLANAIVIMPITAIFGLVS